MNVFIEGPDGSGKTTLINQLSEHYATARIPKIAGNTNIWNAMWCLPDNVTILFDRSPITEIVYRLVDNGKSIFSFDDVLHWSKSSKIVFCNTSSAFEDAINRGENNITNRIIHNKITDVYETVIGILKMAGCDVMFYDWHYQTPGDVIKFIEGGESDDV